MRCPPSSHVCMYANKHKDHKGYGTACMTISAPLICSLPPPPPFYVRLSSYRLPGPLRTGILRHHTLLLPVPVIAAATYGSSYEYPFSPTKPAPSILVCTPSFLHKYTNMKAIPLFCKVCINTHVHENNQAKTFCTVRGITALSQDARARVCRGEKMEYVPTL